MSEPKYKLVDLSKWNGNVDFHKLKNDGIDGAIIRTGFGIESPSQVDRRFEEYYSKAKKEGLYIGAYHYSYAKDPAGAIAEAKFMLKIIKGKSFDLPIYGDFEEQGKLSKSVCTEMCSKFCEELEKSGAWAGIYSYDTFFRDKLDSYIPDRYTVWVARVENVFPKCVPAEKIGIWQNSWKGRPNGTNGNTDMDMCYKDFPNLIKNAKKNVF